MKRLLVVICLVLASLSGAAIGTGHGTAHAAGMATGGGTTNACARHATNAGNSYAYGLTCANIVVTLTRIDGVNYSTTITGQGLQPGSTVTGCELFSDSTAYQCGVIHTNGYVPVVGADGTFFWSVTGSCSQDVTATSVYFIGTAANGSTYTSPTYPYSTASVC
jgi:hypothetical protein